MKLKNKLRISYLALVSLVILATTIFMHISVNLAFQEFMDRELDRIEDQLRRQNDSSMDMDNIRPKELQRRLLFVAREFEEGSPERLFLEKVNTVLLLVAMLAVILALAFSEFVSSLLLRRFESLYQAIVDYKQSGQPIQVEAMYNDEIYQLELAYNDLMAEIQKQEEVRKEFFIDMSHELKTPITAIYGYLHGLKDGVFKPSQKFLDKPLSEVERMQQIITEMMDLAKMETGKIVLHKSEIDLGKITDTLIQGFKKEADSRKISFKIKGNFKLKADKQKIKQVLVNLISNAISYGDSNSQIDIAMASKNGVATWEITNQAVNFKVENLKLLFERFYRADKSRKQDKEDLNLGIGLSIVKKLMQAHNGHVRVSYKNKKICFILEFPSA